LHNILLLPVDRPTDRNTELDRQLYVQHGLKIQFTHTHKHSVAFLYTYMAIIDAY